MEHEEASAVSKEKCGKAPFLLTAEQKQQKKKELDI